MKETYYLGMEHQWLAHILLEWYDSGVDVDIVIGRSRKTPRLVVAQITIDPKEIDEVILVNKLWKQTNCKIYKK